MRILIATPLSAPDSGGPATHLSLLEETLQRRGIQYTTVSFRDVRDHSRWTRHIHYFSRLTKVARSHDRIYALDASSVGFSAWLVSYLFRKPLIVRIAGISAWEMGVVRGQVHDSLDVFVERPSTYSWSVHLRLWVERHVLCAAEAIVVPSHYFKSVVVALGLPAKKIHVVYSGVSTHHDQSVLTAGRVGGRIISAGRLVPWKGFSELIEAVVQVRATVPSAHLMIFGDGPLRPSLEALIRERGAEAYVGLCGNVSRNDLDAALVTASVFVLNTSYEGFSHQLLEAMGAGIPIVTTPVGGNQEMLRDGEDALLVSYNDRARLADAIMLLLSDAKLRQTIAVNAHRRVEQFSYHHREDDLIAILTL